MDENKNAAVAPTAGATAPSAENNAGNTKSFSQGDLDELAGKVRREEKAKYEKLVNDSIAAAIKEYDRQAKLTQEEKEKEARTKREQELADRETAITLRERRIEAQDALIQANVPVELVDFVVDMDQEKTKTNVDKLTKAYRKAVEAGVAEKLKGKVPTDYAGSNDSPKNKGIIRSF